MYIGKYPVLHIFGQHSHHMEAFILGNGKGLVALRDAINEAIFLGRKESQHEVYCNDGEGYTVYVKKMTEDIDQLPVPYTADYAKDKTGISPASFFK